MRVFSAAVLLGLTSACSLPRGAALQSEVLAGSEDAAANFGVMPVTRDNLAKLQSWPATGGGYSWPNASRGGGALSIKPGDTLDVVVWDSQQNSLLTTATQKTVDIKGLQVSSDGMIFVPYIDRINVSGLTTDQARDAIQTKLEPIVPAAQVQVAVTPGNGNIVDLVSGVQTPGRFPLVDRNFTILSLISQGGGIAPGLRNPIVRLQREGQSYTIPAEQLLANPALNTVLRGGDRVVVQSDVRYFVALGATGKEEMAYFPKEEVSALDALSLIGGLSDARADLKGVLVLREYSAAALRSDGSGPDKRQMVFSFDLTTVDGLFAARSFQIHPKDVVLATESPVTKVNSVFNLLGASLGIASRL
ncbi:MAG: polysaccharide biosynthesis/export family protein [Cypionkella sp.]|uniref:polysaccharide biosynthesis/export family protein n=1 Tax=Cypionkella sp. TaxID=2811411 RepID=UPI00271FF322|nr:polysaccharide biosynthesis/export family protein [Cypionkella sp.]MDO8327921.1 polysaccharide biosynthesis/export family protein [Cypionkella sp.]